MATKLVNGERVELTPAEEAAFEAERQAVRDGQASIRQSQENDLPGKVADALTKLAQSRNPRDVAFVALALTMLNEINILRTQAGLPERTVGQLRTGLTNAVVELLTA